jgi:hypothetical protein
LKKNLSTFFFSLSAIGNESRAYFYLSLKERRLCLTLLLMSIFYTSSIWIYNDFFADDLNRSMIGYGFNEAGRIFASAIFWVLSAGSPFADISPLPLFLGLASLCYGLTCYARRYLPEDCSLFIKIGCLFPFIASPFLIHNFSYKYDALSMSLSLSVILMIFSFKADRPWRSVLFLFFSLGLYQASMHLFLVLSIVEWIFSVSRHTDNLRKSKVSIGKRLLEFFVGLVVYLMLSKFLSSSAYAPYAMRHSELGFSSTGLLVLMALNFKSYLQLFFLGLTPNILILCLPAIAFACKLKSALKNLSFSMHFWVCSSPLFMILASFLCFLCLKNPIFLPRVMTGFSGVTLFFGLCLAHLAKENRYWGFLVIPMIGFSFVYSFAYGNGLKAQHQYEYFIDAQIAEAISNLNLKISSISVEGEPPLSNQSRLLFIKFPILTPIILNSGWSAWQISARLENDGIVYIHEEQKPLNYFNPNPVFSNQFFSLYQKNADLLILFKTEYNPLPKSTIHDPTAFLSQRIQTSWGRALGKERSQ